MNKIDYVASAKAVRDAVERSKPNKKEVYEALLELLRWATGCDKHSNPYCYPQVKQALRVVAKEQGITDYLDAKL
jgi:hypothetical protein